MYLDRDEDGVADSNEEKVQYTYTNNRLTGITTSTTVYTLVYDAFGNMTQVKAGSNALVTYTYRSGNGKLTRMTYGSGDYEDFSYDSLDRLVSVMYNGVTTYTLTYDANGALTKCVDAKSGITHTYEYDSLGRLIRAWQTTAAGVKTLGVENIYDSYGRADKSSYVIGNKTLAYDLSYKAGSNLVSIISMPTSSPLSGINYTYDNFDRLTKKKVTFSTLHDVYEEYGYKTYSSGGTTYTTPLVSTLTLKKDSTQTAQYTYTYDSLGNILTVSENGVLKLSYEYDALNQLTRENNAYANTTVLYAYDKAGNITAKSQFAYTTGTVTISNGTITSYGYNSTEWKDRLTSYGGTTISYDSLGNPTNWRDGITNIDWDGRKLNSLYKEIFYLGMSYNSDGMRTGKTYTNTMSLDEVSHQYVLDGSKILKETVTGAQSYTNYYLYDEKGSVAGLEYNGSVYYFQKNIQGDIIRICDAVGNTVVQYTYDAWGKVLSTTGTLASTVGARNPFRYRGYYYDTETGWYYLQSRYYDPTVGRFINADAYVSTGQGVLSYNMFAYCLNNPVNMIDKDGTMAAAIAVSSSTFAAFSAWLSTIGGANFWNPIGWIIAGVLVAGVITWAAVTLYQTYQREQAKTISKADEKVKTTVERNSRTRYWTATVRNGYVDIGRSLTYSQAVKEVQAGRSVFTVTWYEAKAVALAAGGTSGRNNENLYPEIDSGKENTQGYYYHYHTYNRKGGHVYYLF